MIPRLFLVDAFCRVRDAGNPAHIVLCDAEPPAAMRRALTEVLVAGDVGFMSPPLQVDADMLLHFETPRAPAPFVAHVTLAAHALRAHLGLPPAPRQQQGEQVIQVTQRSGGAAPEFAIGQPPAMMRSAPEASELSRLLSALGLHAQELDAACPPIIAGAASRRLLLGVDSPARLARLAPDRERLLVESRALEVAGVYVFARTAGVLASVRDGPDVEARMFAPALGIGEDPVSGNAGGMLACYLWQRRLLPARDDRVVLRGTQGAAVGRPGRLRIELSLVAGEVQAMQIVGNAIVNRELAWPAGVTP